MTATRLLGRRRRTQSGWSRPLGLFLAFLLAAAAAQAPLAPAAAGTASASIALSPPSGPPGSSTTVSGQGFGPSEQVRISFDPILVAQAMTDPSGSFTKAIQVPSGARPGQHIVFARGQSSGLAASATFTVRVDWPTFRFDPVHTGVNPYENILNVRNVSGLSINWIGNGFGPGLVFHSSPAVVNGVAYIG